MAICSKRPVRRDVGDQVIQSRTMLQHARDSCLAKTSPSSGRGVSASRSASAPSAGWLHRIYLEQGLQSYNPCFDAWSSTLSHPDVEC